MVRIRLRRVGRKKAPAYRVVVADSKSPRDGKFIEIIGQYAPRSSDEQKIHLDIDRANYWLSVGAQPSDTVRSILRRAGVLKAQHEARLARGRQASAVALPDTPVPAAATPVTPAPVAPTPVAPTPVAAESPAAVQVAPPADAGSVDAPAVESPAVEAPAVESPAADAAGSAGA